MAGETPGATPETTEGADPNATRTDAGVTPEPETAQSVAALQEALRKEREARKKFERAAGDEKRRADDFAKERQTLEDQEKTEIQKAREAKDQFAREKAESDRRAAAAEDRLVQKTIDHEVEREAQKQGFIYPEIAPSVIDRNRVKYDPDTGLVSGVKDAIERLLKDKPGLAETRPRGGTPPLGGGGGNRNGSQNNGGGRGDQPLTPEEDMRLHGNYF